MRIIFSTTIAAALLLAGCGNTDTPAPTKPEADVQQADPQPSEKADDDAAGADSIAALASSREDLSTLVAALEAANLVETLANEGPFTVFAPTNAAFEALPEGALDELLANPEELREVLTYHVVAGEVTSAMVMELTSADTLAGKAVAVDTSDGVVVGSAKVVEVDIKASNGVIHVIDAVMMPPS